MLASIIFTLKITRNNNQFLLVIDNSSKIIIIDTGEYSLILIRKGIIYASNTHKNHCEKGEKARSQEENRKGTAGENWQAHHHH